MFSTISFSTTEQSPGHKQARNKYSRLICIGCRDRRIRCELPSNVKTPVPGQTIQAQTPCYRCRRLSIPCVIRQTILGRPSAQKSAASAANAQHGTIYKVKSHVWIDISVLPTHLATAQLETARDHGLIDSHTRCSHLDGLSLSDDVQYQINGTLLLHSPQSAEKIVIINAIDTIRCEKVEEEWFRHLPTHYGHTLALDLAVKALVQACAYARGVSRLSPEDCFQALMPVLGAVRANIKQSPRDSNDDMLATTALLAPFEGTVKRNGVPTQLHVNGLAAILSARPETHPVTQLARDIVDWYAAESSIMSCIEGTASPFEKIHRTYYANNGPGLCDSDRARIKALGNELLIRMPRLVMLVRELRRQSYPQRELLSAAQTLLRSLLELQDRDAENQLMRTTTVQPCIGSDATIGLSHSLQFASIKDYEALTCYWQSRLSLLRLERCLHCLQSSCAVDKAGANVQLSLLPPSPELRANETYLLARRLVMSVMQVPTLPLFKQQHMLAHAMIVIWGVTMDVNITVDAEATDALSKMLLQRVNSALNVKPELCAGDMDQAADIFVGGERTGRLASHYGF